MQIQKLLDLLKLTNEIFPPIEEYAPYYQLSEDGEEVRMVVYLELMNGKAHEVESFWFIDANPDITREHMLIFKEFCLQNPVDDTWCKGWESYKQERGYK